MCKYPRSKSHHLALGQQNPDSVTAGASFSSEVSFRSVQGQAWSRPHSLPAPATWHQADYKATSLLEKSGAQRDFEGQFTAAVGRKAVRGYSKESDDPSQNYMLPDWAECVRGILATVFELQTRPDLKNVKSEGPHTQNIYSWKVYNQIY